MSHPTYSNLVDLRGYSFPVHVSPGSETRAHQLAARCQRAYAFFARTLESEAAVRLLVLAPEHWQEYTGSPLFGVPQTIDAHTMVVAGQNAELWKMIVPPLEGLPPAEAQAVRAAYGQADGSVDIAGYMDWLPVHELGHLFIDQRARQFDYHWPRRWLVELFCNLALHAFTARAAPEQLSSLTAFPQAMVALGEDHLTYHALQDFERLYADMEPPNFVWYLSRLHVAAQRIYEAAGIDAVRRLFQAIVQTSEPLADDQLANQLRADVHPTVADVLVAWEH